MCRNGQKRCYRHAAVVVSAAVEYVACSEVRDSHERVVCRGLRVIAGCLDHG